MFVRKKKNPSGITSIQVIDKSSGTYKLVKPIGSSSDNKDIEKYYREGYNWIRNKTGQYELDFSNEL